jgi:hypothetical protein
MNGYQLMADSYKKMLEEKRYSEGVVNITEMERRIRVLDLLAKFEHDDKYFAFESSMFNNIYKGYVSIAIDNIIKKGTDAEKKSAETIRDVLLNEARLVLEEVSAKDAEKYYITD